MGRIGNSVPDFFLRRERAAGLEEVALYVESAETVGEADAIERVPGLRVTPSFFRTLGVDASIGRTFLEEEMSPGAEPAVLLTDAYWRARFAASADVVGRTLTIAGTAATVVGVLPPSFGLPAQPDARVILPLVFQPSAWRATVRRVFFGPLPPTRIGRCSWIGRGSQSASLNV